MGGISLFGAGLIGLAGAALAAGSGRTSGVATSPLALQVVGTRIVDSKDQPVRLRGVNTASLEWTSDGEGHIVQTVKTAIEDWNVNVVRLPLSQDRWFGKAPEQKDDGKAYRALVKEIVDLCASKGCYIILDLHWSDCGEWGQNIGQHSMPDENSLAFWKDLAPVYANHPAVLYDLYNEPHDVSWEIWQNGGTVKDRPNTRRGGEPKTFRGRRDADAAGCGAGHGGEERRRRRWTRLGLRLLRHPGGRQLKDPHGNGVIYANHAYNNKGHSADVWISRMEKAAAKLPVIVSEFGGSGGPNRRHRRGGGGAAGKNATGDDWLLHVMQAIEDHKWSYTAWDLHPQAGPTLFRTGTIRPTPDFGVFVKQALAGTLPRYTPPSCKIAPK